MTPLQRVSTALGVLAAIGTIGTGVIQSAVWAGDQRYVLQQEWQKSQVMSELRDLRRQRTLLRLKVDNDEASVVDGLYLQTLNDDIADLERQLDQE